MPIPYGVGIGPGNLNSLKVSVLGSNLVKFQPARPGVSARRSPFRNLVRLDVHLANAVMIPRIEFREPDVSVVIDSNAVSVRNVREESKFLCLDIELAEWTSRTPDIALKIGDGRMPARSSGLASRGVTQAGPRRVRLHLRHRRPVVFLAIHFKFFTARIESCQLVLRFDGQPNGTVRSGQNLMNKWASRIRQTPR